MILPSCSWPWEYSHVLHVWLHILYVQTAAGPHTPAPVFYYQNCVSIGGYLGCDGEDNTRVEPQWMRLLREGDCLNVVFKIGLCRNGEKWLSQGWCFFSILAELLLLFLWTCFYDFVTSVKITHTHTHIQAVCNVLFIFSIFSASHPKVI